jgi:hypothetical protein
MHFVQIELLFFKYATRAGLEYSGPRMNCKRLNGKQ